VHHEVLESVPVEIPTIGVDAVWEMSLAVNKFLRKMH
jgi:hypothetical protein